MRWFDPQPDASELPSKFPSPFATEPHPLARRAALELASSLPAMAEGKMLGALVVAARDGRIGYLCAFSGMLDGTWDVAGFAPPAFDTVARDSFWPAGERALAALDGEERAAMSRQLLVRIQETYVFANAAGERKAMREIFAPAEPPGGAGDCAAPKLFAQAYREGLRPIAIAEIWCGPPPAAGGRHAGVLYPACRGKCGPILAHMLGGLDAEPVPVFGNGRISADEPRAIFEDDHIVVVVKPAGLLSVPGRGGALRDSVLARLRARYPAATGPLLVHRLDLDASGLLLCAKDSATHAALQRLFALRLITKRYSAWLDGEVAGEAGTVELPLRVDLDDRPRQIFDPIHGKAAITEWRVVDRSAGRTRVELSPLTGRAHQLRVHASHPRGIGAPIVGDRLYGRAGERLLLHAAHLAFVHPHTGARVEFDDAPPF